MYQHKILLERQASLAEFAEAKQSRILAAEKFQKLEDETLLQRKSFLATWLAAPDVYEDQERGQEARSRHPQSGRWLLKKPRFSSWFDLSYNADPILWIHGKPGSGKCPHLMMRLLDSNQQLGKSVLSSLIVDEAQRIDNAKTLLFYFNADDDRKRTFVAMTRSFLSQMLRLDSDIVSPLYESIMTDSAVSLTTRKAAEKFLEIGMKALRRTYIVLDGLDECVESEQKAICSWIRRFVDTPTSTSEPNRCVVVSQYDASTKTVLALIPTITISATDIAGDIHSYCCAWKDRFIGKFQNMEGSEFSEVVDVTVQSADGKLQTHPLPSTGTHHCESD